MDSTPPQVQKVSDNLNRRTKHRRERGDDDYAKHSFDWMASLFIKDRINTNLMSASGPVKDAADITIEVFVPTDTEKNYILNLQLQFELWGMEQFLVTSSHGRVELSRGPVSREKLSEIETVKKEETVIIFRNYNVWVSTSTCSSYCQEVQTRGDG